VAPYLPRGEPDFYKTAQFRLPTLRRMRCIHLLALPFVWLNLAPAHADGAPAQIDIVGEPGFYPESLTSTSDGAVIIGSAQRTIFRAAPGAALASPWIELPASGPRSVFGLLADERSNTLWACSGTLGKVDAPPPRAALYSFDLAAGELKASYELPTADALCNDIAVDASGAVYVTDSPNMEIARLAPGAAALVRWSGDAYGAKGDTIDGIAIVGRRVIVNVLKTNKLFAVPIERGGTAGTPLELALDDSITRPDGMRSIGGRLLVLAENAAGGRVLRVKVDAKGARIRAIAPGPPRGAIAVTLTGKTLWALESGPYDTSGPKPRARAVRMPSP
jgi:sugar lactone lactonase YvrE